MSENIPARARKQEALAEVREQVQSMSPEELKAAATKILTYREVERKWRAVSRTAWAPLVQLYGKLSLEELKALAEQAKERS